MLTDVSSPLGTKKLDPVPMATCNECGCQAVSSTEFFPVPVPSRSVQPSDPIFTVLASASKNRPIGLKPIIVTLVKPYRYMCKARNINVNMESYCPQALDGLLNKFYVEIRKRDGTD